jgi:osmotically-inducible protein OsmY
LLKEDWELRQDIRDALFWEPAINQTEIVVSVQDGTAILAGTVDTWLERRLARQKAYQQGALIVRNHLRVREWSDFEP